MSPARRLVLSLVLAAAGGTLLAWQVSKVGIDNITTGLTQVGWGFLVVLGLSLVRFTLRSLGWVLLMNGRVPLASAVAATIAGDAVGNLTPLSLIVSEPAKSLYLRAKVPASQSFAALTAENFFYSVSVAVFIICGTAALIAAFPLSRDLQTAGFVAIALMAVVLAGALAIGWYRPKVASGALGRMPFLKMDALIEAVRDFEVKTYSLARQPRGRLAAVVGCEVAFHIVSFAESYYVLWLLTGRSSPLAAFVLDTVNRIVNVVFRPVPLKAGVDEVSTSWVAQAVGFAPVTGVTMALVRKGRVLLWAALGMALFARRGGQTRPASTTAVHPD